MKLRGLTRFIAATIGIAVLCFGSPDAGAVESSTTKIATVNIQEVLLGSTAGQEVKKMLEAKVDELQGKFKKEQEEVDALRAEIEKKSSVWSPEVKDEKERDYQKRVREVQLKTEDAQFELQQMEKQLMSPILNELQQVIKELGEKNGYTLIMDSRAGLLYVNESLDISDIVQQELDKRQQKEKK
jgi:outer membrane protein